MRYLYLWLALAYVGGTAVVWLTRRDLRPVILRAGPFGALVEVASEWCYLHDYWRPESVLGTHWPFLEDALYGFGVTALAACAGAFWVPPPPWRRSITEYVYEEAPAIGLLLTAIGCYAFMLVVVRFSGAPSVRVMAIVFAILGLFAALVRPDLIWTGVKAGLIMGLLAFTTYWLALDVVINGHSYLNHVLLPSSGEVRVLGNLPLTQVFWNIARGWCIGMLYPAVTGMSLRTRKIRG